MDEFIECETCKNKPGMPELCDGCYRNRKLISKLRDDKNMLENKLSIISKVIKLYEENN